MKKLHMIGNAHLDPVWLWTWQEGFQETKATFKSALDRLSEYDDFVFTSSSAQFYEWVEENDPVMFEQIKERIKEGRWILCGGWWVQPDCNIPSGESFARHTLIAQNYFNDKFGITAKVGYNVDSFGHNGMLPQILRLSNMNYYVFMRPGPHEKGLPGRNFIWESNDGSRVTAFQLPFAYCTFGDLKKHIIACIEDFDSNIDDFMCFYGVGNHGGGPTIENIETIKKLQKELKDVEIIFSTPDKYFKELEEKKYKLPIVHDDLKHHASGCYSVHSEIKAINRASEHGLLKAEKYASISSAIGFVDYPDNFNQGWKRVLFNQFHDILAGTSIKKAYEDARNELGEALSIASRNENNALQGISFSIDIPEEDNMIPVVVFNPNSWEVTSPVEVEFGKFGNQKFGDKYKVFDCDNQEMPCQIISSHVKVNGRNRILFPAQVPPFGYATFRIYASDDKPAIYKKGVQTNILENEYIHVEVDSQSGGLASIYDKITDTEFLDGIGAISKVYHDNSDTWSHGIIRFDKLDGLFKPISIKKVEDGDVRTSIRVISKYQDSTLIQTFSLYKHSADIHVDFKVNWQEKFKCLKVEFPVNLENYKATYEIPFGHITKACNGEEEAMQNWMDLTGLKPDEKLTCGLSILNNGKYSASMNHNVMKMTILRSPVFAHHNPHILQEETEAYDFIDQGIQELSYVISPHTGTWKEAGIVNKAYELNQRCTTIIESFHKGKLPQRGQYININCKNVIVSSLKKAEKSKDYAIRIYEVFGENTEVEIDIPLLGQKINTNIKPYEIKTFLINSTPESAVREVNFLEWEKE